MEFLRSKGEKYEELYLKLRINLEKQIRPQKTIFLEELNKFLHEYLTYGSYPRIVLEKDKHKKKELLKNLFTTYIEKDIIGLYGIKYRENVVKLLKAITSMLGSVVNYETLSLNSGLKYKEVREILPLLEDSFIISITKPFYRNLMNELRKNPKIYFLDYGIRNYLLENFEHIDFGKLYENFINNEFKRRDYKVKYWRTTAKTEVDFVLEHKEEIIPIEVKIKPKITRSFMSFIQIYKPERAVILNLNEVQRKKINDCDIYVLPFIYI